jgi:hypothetical protein
MVAGFRADFLGPDMAAEGLDAEEKKENLHSRQYGKERKMK